MNWLDKLERKFGRYAIHNLMYYIIILYVVGLVVQLFAPSFYYQYLSLDVNAILHGQIWRVVTFIIQPPQSSYIFMIFALYLYYMLGRELERTWGAFRFNLYFFAGMLFHVIAAFAAYFITGVSFPLGTWYLNMSLFLAFAATFPDLQFWIWFVIPIKAKWLALIESLFILYGLLLGPAATRVEIVFSLLNFILFFFMTRNYSRVNPREIKRKQEFKAQVKMRPQGRTHHRCAVCGRTELDGDDLEFRYCSKCEGNYEYCQDHLYTHKHVTK